MFYLCVRQLVVFLTLGILVSGLAEAGPVPGGATVPDKMAPLDVRSEWLRGTWGQAIGDVALEPALLGDGDSTFELIATASSDDGQNDRWYVVDEVGGDLQQVFRSAVYGGDVQAVAVGDIDGDGLDEVLVSSGGFIEVWDGWPLALDRTLPTSGFAAFDLQVGDVDGDAGMEIVYRTDSNAYVMDAISGGEERSWSCFCLDLAVGQLDGDVALEIVLAHSPGQVVDGASGAVEFEDPNGFGATVVVGELDGAAPEDFVSGSWNEVFRHAFVGPGDYSRSLIASPFDDFDEIALADLDGDGADELIYAETQFGDLRFYEGDGTLMSLVNNPYSGVSGLIAAPFDGDAGLDVVWGSGLTDPNRNELLLYEVGTATIEWRTHDASGPFYGLAHGDVDADGQPELVYGSLQSTHGTRPGQYFVHDVATGVEEYASGAVGVGPNGLHRVALAQLDGDAQLEVLVAVNAGTSGTIPRVKVFDGLSHAEQYEIVGAEHLNFQDLEVRDVDRDGSFELVISTGWDNAAGPGSGLLVFDAVTGSFEWEAALDLVHDDFPLLAVGDFDGDFSTGGGLEIALSHDDSRTFSPDFRIFDGVMQVEEQVDGALTITSLAVRAGSPDVLFAGTSSGEIHRFDWASGAFVFELSYVGPIYGLNVRDVDADGVPDYLFIAQGELVILSGADNSPLFFETLAGADIGRRDSVVVDDVDADGALEIWVNRGTDGMELFEIPGGPAPGAPVVTILQPSASPTTIFEGETLTLEGTASDEIDDDLPIEWRSDLDGVLGNTWFLEVQLSLGSHTITASATDLDGNTTEATTLVDVLSPAPMVTIASPEDGERFGLNIPITFVATASDPQEGDLTANIAWESDLTGIVGYGGSISLWTLGIGVHTITAKAWDFEGHVGEDSVTLEVVDPSTCTPSSGTPVDEDWEAGAAGWTATGLWHVATDSACLSPGYTSAVTSFYFGQDGSCDYATGATAIGDLISPPVSVDETSQLTFSSYRVVESGGGNYDRTEVYARQVGSATWTLLWSRSSSDASSTAWATEGPISLTAWDGQDVELRFAFHSVDSAANDTLGWMIDDVQVTASDPCPPSNTVPVITLDSPAYGATVGTTFDLVGTVIDPEETDPSADLQWSSTTSGPLGQGGTLTVTLPEGTHLIEAAFTDSYGLFVSEYLSVTVSDNTPPTLELLAPSPGTTVVEGTAVGLSATASDAEDGDLTAAIAWTSSLDGALGSGGTLSAVLSVGSHTITASVVDAAGETTSVQTSATVNANTSPSVNLLAPADGQIFQEAEAITFSASATDGEDGDLSAQIEWSSSRDGVLGSGTQVVTAGLTAGQHTVTASVTDSHGATGTASVTLRINAAPSLTVLAPSRSPNVIETDPVVFTAIAGDTQDGDLSPTISWSSDLDGPIGVGGSFAVTTLSVGMHTITVSVTDSDGGEATVTRSVTVRANTPPTVTLGLPTDGTRIVAGNSEVFSATASDAEDGTLNVSIVWTSDRDGQINVGASFVHTLSPGAHTITASVTDRHGATATDAITVLVDAPPSLSITDPVDGATVSAGEPVSFTGTAMDDLDGDLSGAIAWVSDLDGVIGFGADFDRLLTAGLHTITASVTDSASETASASIQLTVEPAPTVSIISPADGGHMVPGESVTLEAGALGTDGVDASAQVTWSSDLDGALGSGPTISATLSNGVHTVTAAVVDALGRRGAATGRLWVSDDAPPVVSLASPTAGGWCYGPPCSASLQATAVDPEDGDLAGSGTWTSDLVGVIDADGDGIHPLGRGVHTLTYSVTDSAGNTLSRSSVFRVLDANTAAPAVDLMAPTGGTAVKEGDAVTLSATAFDGDLGGVSAFLEWTLQPSGTVLGQGASLELTAGVELPVGTQTLRARLVDGALSAQEEVALTVEANAAPTVAITSPADGVSVLQGEVLSLAASAVDEEDGDLSASITWTSNLDGALGTGVSLAIASLSVGSHALTATAVDHLGASASATLALTVLPKPVTVSFFSIGDEDGWIRETKEASGVGGPLNHLEGSRNKANKTLRVGDQRKDRQYLSILSFDTSAIPDGATIQSVTLKVRRGSVSGQNPFATHGNLVIDVKTGTFGAAALESSDFEAVADAVAAGSLSEPTSNGSDASGTLDAAGRAAVNTAGRTQLRLRFELDDDDDRGKDFMGFYAGETSSPQLPELIVTYQE